VPALSVCTTYPVGCSIYGPEKYAQKSLGWVCPLDLLGCGRGGLWCLPAGPVGDHGDLAPALRRKRGSPSWATFPAEDRHAGCSLGRLELLVSW